MATSVEKRRQVRALEAKRDALIQNKQKQATQLAMVRVELAKKRKASV